MAPRTEVYTIEKIQSDKVIMANEDSTSFEDALKKTEFGRMHIIVLILAGMSLSAVINETMGMMFIMSSSQCDLNLSATDKGILSSVAFLGIAFSSHLWGYLADTKGRRKVLCYTTLMSNIFAVAAFFVRDYWPFIICRFFSGFFISGPSATIYAYIGEFNCSKNRGRVVAYASWFVGFSQIFIPAIAWGVLSLDFSLYLYEGMYIRPWRLLILFYALPGFISALFILKLKESPKFLMSQGREDEALAVLKWLYNKNTGKAEETYPVKKITPEVLESYHESKNTAGRFKILRSMRNQTLPLMKPPHLLNFSICCFLQASVFMASSGVGLWYAEISNRLSSDNAGGNICYMLSHRDKVVTDVLSNGTTTNLFEDAVCDDSIKEKAFLDAIYLGIAYLLGYVVLSQTIKPVGREIILPLCLFIGVFFGITLQYFQDPLVVILLFSCFLMFIGMCITVINSTVVLLFPTQYRAMAVCCVLMCGRFGTMLGTNIVGQFLETNCVVTFWFFTGVIFFCGLLTFLLPSKKNNPQY